MKLSTWVNLHGGQSETARLLGIQKTRVHKWCRGVCLPSARMMFEIHKHSRGRVSYQDMIETYLEGQHGKRRKK